MKEIKAVKTTQSAPSLKANEIAIKIKMHLPETLFTKPQLQANISVDDKNVSPQIIDAETMQNITEIMEQQLGVDMTINVVNPSEQDTEKPDWRPA